MEEGFILGKSDLSLKGVCWAGVADNAMSRITKSLVSVAQSGLKHMVGLFHLMLFRQATKLMVSRFILAGCISKEESM